MFGQEKKTHLKKHEATNKLKRNSCKIWIFFLSDILEPLLSGILRRSIQVFFFFTTLREYLQKWVTKFSGPPRSIS